MSSASLPPPSSPDFDREVQDDIEEDDEVTEIASQVPIVTSSDTSDPPLPSSPPAKKKKKRFILSNEVQLLPLATLIFNAQMASISNFIWHGLGNMTPSLS